MWRHINTAFEKKAVLRRARFFPFRRSGKSSKLETGRMRTTPNLAFRAAKKFGISLPFSDCWLNFKGFQPIILSHFAPNLSRFHCCDTLWVRPHPGMCVSSCGSKNSLSFSQPTKSGDDVSERQCNSVWKILFAVSHWRHSHGPSHSHHPSPHTACSFSPTHLLFLCVDHFTRSKRQLQLRSSTRFVYASLLVHQFHQSLH